MTTLTSGFEKEERKQLRRLYFRSWQYGILFCHSRLCGNSFMYALYPFINWLYPKPEDKEKKLQALQRHDNFFNNNAVFFPMCAALIAAMEKQRAENPNFDPASIPAVKASLVGPFSAIGDTLFWVTWRVIAAGIGLQFALQGNVLGPTLFLDIFSIPSISLQYYMFYTGYKLGINFLKTAAESGTMQKVIIAVSTTGLIMVGGMVASFVKVPLVATFSMEGIQKPILDVFNGIVPGLLDLTLVFIVLALLRKKINPIWIVLGTFVVAILGAWFKIF